MERHIKTSTDDDDTKTIPQFLSNNMDRQITQGANGNNLASAAVARHPVDTLQQQQKHHDLEFVRKIYGPGLAMRLATEQQIARSLDGTPTVRRRRRGRATLLYGDICTGNDSELSNGDHMMHPAHRPDLYSPPSTGLHVAMERELGMME